MNKTLVILVGLVLILAQPVFGSVAIYGQDRQGRLFHLPSRLCVYGMQQVRVRADVLDNWGRRWNAPYSDFVWRMTLTDGAYQQWDARFDFDQGAFSRGRERDTIYVEMPMDLRYSGRLEAVASGERPTAVELVDVYFGSPLSCQWAPGDFYVNGPRPPQTPIGVSPEGGYPCFNQCTEGFVCTDACPFGAACRQMSAPNGRMYWRISSCRDGF